MSIIDQLRIGGGISERNRSGDNTQQFLVTGIVVEFISNPAEQRSQIIDIAGSISNSSYINRMPRNSAVVRLVGIDTQPMICYPFFSPHFCLPIKAGEQVWIMFPEGRISSLGYWMTRKATDITVDDINYTHLDRVSKYGAESPEIDQVFDPATFPLGQDSNPEHNTLPGSDPYEAIVDKSVAHNTQFSGEPIPRFSKMCGDLTIQGSNNTLISLGSDRDGDPFSGTGDKLAGSIDIVAGRGMTTATSPTSVVENTRGYEETDKAPHLTGKALFDNPAEGDPDFNNDLSRIYLSMNTNGDDNFSLTYPDSIESVTSKPYAIVKSDEVRLIARETGSIRITKEGSNKAVITMLSDGKILIDSSNVMIGAGATEQIVLGNVLTDLIGRIIDQINLISVPTGVGPSGPPVNAAAFSAIKAQLSTALSGIGKIK
tara:strand:- start:48 stop:1337 length:1290 start_codon:yes stop_codon:yes gene_type:complete